MGGSISVTQRRFPYWARGPARIVGEEIVLDEDRAELYTLSNALSVEFAIEDLDEEYPRSAVAFARRYGLLWHGAEYLGTGECRERLSDWWDVANELHFVLTLYRSVQEAVRTGSVEPIRSLEIDWTAVDLSALMVEGSSRLGWPEEEPDTTEEYTDELYLADVCQILATFVNLGLEDCGVGLLSLSSPDTEYSQPGKFLLGVAPQNLVSAAYASYATVIAKRQEIEQCPGCGRMFSPESGRQKYCTKSCASTSRWRRWKKRQDEHLGVSSD
ncbi:MAG: hypothetical protein WKF53_06365 [Rubrobacter sp.]